MAKDDFTCGSLDIAIIGMSGRFSGAESVPEGGISCWRVRSSLNRHAQKTIMGTLGLGCAI